MLTEVGALEQDIETDCRRTAFAQVLDDLGVNGTVPFVIVAEFGQGCFIDIDNVNVLVKAVANGYALVGVVVFFVGSCGMGRGLEK